MPTTSQRRKSASLWKKLPNNLRKKMISPNAIFTTFGLIFSSVNLGESGKQSSVALNVLEEHLFGANPILLIAVKCLIHNHPFLCFGVESRTDIAIHSALEMLKISRAVVRLREHQKHFFNQRNVPSTNLIGCRRVTAREMVRAVVMLKKQRLVMR